MTSRLALGSRRSCDQPGDMRLLGSPRSLHLQLGGIEESPTLDHHVDGPGVADVLEGVLSQDQEICLLADLDGPQPLVGPDLGCGHLRRCRQCLDGRQPRPNQELELAMYGQAVKDGDHARVGPQRQPHTGSVGQSGQLDRAFPRRAGASGSAVLCYVAHALALRSTVWLTNPSAR